MCSKEHAYDDAVRNRPFFLKSPKIWTVLRTSSVRITPQGLLECNTSREPYRYQVFTVPGWLHGRMHVSCGGRGGGGDDFAGTVFLAIVYRHCAECCMCKVMRMSSIVSILMPHQDRASTLTQLFTLANISHPCLCQHPHLFVRITKVCTNLSSDMPHRL